MTVGDCAKVVRSKNAGIGLITVDVVCDDEDGYGAVKLALTRDAVARAYAITAGDVLDVVEFPAGLAFKVVLCRPRIAGGQGLGETDLYGSAQYLPVAGMALNGSD
jgi:hypothetical protein